MEVALSEGNSALSHPRRPLHRDLLRAYAGVAVGFVVGIVTTSAARIDLLILVGGYVVGPVGMLALLMAIGNPSKGLSVVRLFGASLGWLSFASLWLLVPVFRIPIATLGSAGLIVFTLLATAFVTAGTLGTNLAWAGARR